MRSRSQTAVRMDRNGIPLENSRRVAKHLGKRQFHGSFADTPTQIILELFLPLPRLPATRVENHHPSPQTIKEALVHTSVVVSFGLPVLAIFLLALAPSNNYDAPSVNGLSLSDNTCSSQQSIRGSVSQDR
eukprot:g29609.t1